MSETPRCPFTADVMVKTPGGATRRTSNVQCSRDQGHERTYGEERDHEFITNGNLTYGARRENGRWVSRR